MANPFTHIELSTTDMDKAKTFYKGLFDWELQDLPDMDYTMIGTGKAPGGGMMKQMIPGAPSSWLVYMEVDDIVASTKKAAELGATVMRDVMEVMGAGHLSILIDPTGAALGLWQPKKP